MVPPPLVFAQAARQALQGLVQIYSSNYDEQVGGDHQLCDLSGVLNPFLTSIFWWFKIHMPNSWCPNAVPAWSDFFFIYAIWWELLSICLYRNSYMYLKTLVLAVVVHILSTCIHNYVKKNKSVHLIKNNTCIDKIKHMYHRAGHQIEGRRQGISTRAYNRRASRTTGNSQHHTPLRSLRHSRVGCQPKARQRIEPIGHD